MVVVAEVVVLLVAVKEVRVDEALEIKPRPKTKVVEVEFSPVARVVNGKAEPEVIQEPPMAKQPAVMLYPTLEVEVAWPMIFKPRMVVVPKPVPEISSAEIEVVAVPAIVVVER